MPQLSKEKNNARINVTINTARNSYAPFDSGANNISNVGKNLHNENTTRKHVNNIVIPDNF